MTVPARARWADAAVALAAIVVHARSAWFGLTDLDDRDLVVDDHAFLARPENLLRAFGRPYMHVVDPAHAYYRPLVTVSYGLDALWSGANPAGYHVTNIALHALASMLFLAVLRRFAMPPVVAAAAAMVFAVHPALAAAVAWIPGRNDSLLAVFSLASWLFFLRDGSLRGGSRPAAPTDGTRRDHALRDRALHFVFFALALLTKETAVALPLVWTAQFALRVPDGGCVPDGGRVSDEGPVPDEGRVHNAARPLRRADALIYGSGWAVLVGATALIHHLLSSGVGGMGSLRAGALAENLPTLVSSLGKIAFPVSPALLATAEDLSVWPGIFAVIALAAAARFVPGVRWRVVALGVAAFTLLLLPVLLAPGTLMLDNRLVLPACGVLIAIAEIARAAAFEHPHRIEGVELREQAETTDRRLFVGLSAVVVVVLAALTVGYEGSFRDPRAFAREAVADAPHSALAHFCLGRAYQADGDGDRALAEYETSLTLGPGEVVHNNIAVLYMARARWPEAERELREELAIDPRYARAYGNLAIVLRREGRDEDAQAATEAQRRLEDE